MLKVWFWVGYLLLLPPPFPGNQEICYKNEQLWSSEIIIGGKLISLEKVVRISHFSYLDIYSLVNSKKLFIAFAPRTTVLGYSKILRWILLSISLQRILEWSVILIITVELMFEVKKKFLAGGQNSSDAYDLQLQRTCDFLYKGRAIFFICQV